MADIEHSLEEANSMAGAKELKLMVQGPDG
jgi:hypothetical protein